MLTRSALAGMVYVVMLASCVTSPDEANEDSASETDGDGGGGEGCIEGPCEDTVTETCEAPTEIGNAAPVQMPKHDATSEGQRCLDCHTTPAHESIPKFDFGGRVVDPETGLGRANAIIRLPSNEGGIAVRTNDSGYFWWPMSERYGGQGDEETNRPMFPSAVGVEINGTTSMMCAKAINGNCGSCHDGTTTAPIFGAL